MKRTFSLFELIALLLIVVLGAWLRLGWAGVNSFSFDEAYVSLAALNMARGGQFATLGMPSSAGVPNLPFTIWIFSLPYAVSLDPLVATQFVGILGLITLLGLWWLTRHAFGSTPALLSALFFAISPYAVWYSRNIWSQNLLPLLVVCWLIAAYNAHTAALRGRWIALTCFIGGIGFQVHFAGIALAFCTIYALLRFRWWRSWRVVLLGSVIAAICLAPTAYRLLNEPNLLRSLRRAVDSGVSVSFSSVEQAIRLGLGMDWAYLSTGDVPNSMLTLPAAAIATVLAGLLLLMGSFTLIQAARAGQLIAELVVVTAIVSSGWLIIHTTPPLPHYQLIALPAIAISIGAAVSTVQNQVWRSISCVLVLFVGIVWVGQIENSLQIAGSVETPNGLGTPLHTTRTVANSIPADRPVLFFTHNDDLLVDGEAAVFAVLWYGRDARILSGGSILILPNTPAYLIATLAPIQAWEELRDSGLITSVNEFPRREGVLPFVMSPYDGTASPEGFQPLDAVLFDDGARLEGWRVRRVGDRLRISTFWQVETLPPTGVFQQFHHLRNASTAEGEPFAISDVPLSTHHWRIGDRLLLMADFLNVPEGEYWIEVGHYTLPDLQRIPSASGDAIRLDNFQWK